MDVFKLIIDLDDDTGLTFNALVDRPAHNKRLMAFEKQKEKKQMFFDDSKRMVTGVAISANQLIFRSDKELGEYYVYFEPKEVEKMVRKMSKQKLLSSVNLMHDDKRVVNDMTFIEGYFVSDTKRPPNDTQNIQNGSYVMTYYVEDEVLYNEIKSGRYVGYSVEGLFDQVPVNFKTKSINNLNKTKMKKSNFYSRVFKKENFAEVTTTDGVVISYEGELAVGTAVFITGEDGTQMAAPEGSLSLEDGKTIVVDADGIVTEVMEAEAEATEDVVDIEEIFEVVKTLNSKIDSIKSEFEAFKKDQVPAVKKFAHKSDTNAGWSGMIKTK